MNTARLLEHYQSVGDAPDAIGRLRCFILNLAVRGKLVPQDPTDEPASVALGRVETPFFVEGPFELPASWVWANVGSVADARLGKMLDQAKNKGTPRRYLRNINVRWFDFDLSNLLEMRIEDSELPEFALRSGDVLICEGGEPGRAAVWDERESDIYFQKAIYRVRFSAVVDSGYFVKALRASADDSRLAEYFTGTSIKHFTGKGLDAYLFSLPPLAEQRRIVAKVNELMALCDRLEAARAARETMRDRLTAASLARLNASDPAPAIFGNHAQFALDTLPALTTRPDQIKQLRQTILNLAVRGKLVPQDPKDEPASELLARFAAGKSQNSKGRDWTEGLCNSEDQSFPTPPGWAWTRIADTAERVTVGYVGPMKDQYVEAGIPFLRSQNVRANRFREEGLIHISPKFHQTIIKSALAPGDVVVVRSGNVGTACVIPPTMPEANCSDLVVVQKPECVVSTYLCFYLNSLAASHVEAGSVGVALTHFNTKSVATMPLPLPPLAEQHRIVAKVDELMVLCDRLEASLATGDATRRHLLDALLAEALAPADTPAMETVA